VDALAETFGKNCEVVLHDFSKPDQSIVKIANGHVTGRGVGGPATGLILSFVGKKGRGKESLVGYCTKTKRGDELKSTTVLIRNGTDRVVGALCVNINLTPFLSTKSLLEELCLVSNPGFPETEEPIDEKFEASVKNLIDDLLEKSIKGIGKPVVNMRKEDKLNIITDLKEKGLFLIRGSAQRVSRELNVSLPTVYKYLEEIKDI